MFYPFKTHLLSFVSGVSYHSSVVKVLFCHSPLAWKIPILRPMSALFLFGHRSMFRAFLWLLVCNCLPFPARPSLFCFSGEVELYAFSFLCQGISLVNFSTSFAFFRPLVPSLVHILRWLLFTSPGSVSVGTVSIHPMPPFPQGAKYRISRFS